MKILNFEIGVSGIWVVFGGRNLNNILLVVSIKEY